MATLGPSTWLNDEIINVCMSMLQERDKRHREALKGSPTCHFFNSFFLNKLYKDSGKYNYNDVRRWTLPVRLKNAGQPFTSILDCDRIIIPGNQGNMHWVCAVIDIKNHKFIMYDSLGVSFDTVFGRKSRPQTWKIVLTKGVLVMVFFILSFTLCCRVMTMHALRIWPDISWMSIRTSDKRM